MTVDVNSTQAIFEVTNIVGSSLNNMILYFDVGTPKGHDTIIANATFELLPKLISLSIQEGSIGGSIIKARVEGMGVAS